MKHRLALATLLTVLLMLPLACDKSGGSGAQTPSDGASSAPADKASDADKKDAAGKANKKGDKPTRSAKKGDAKKDDAKKDDAAPAKAEGTAVVFPGSPFDEELQTFTLTWKGEDAKVPLHQSFDKESREIATLTVKKGAAIDWNESKMKVTQPLVVVASKNVEINDTRPSDDPAAEPESIQLSKGSELKVFKYEGEGTCILGVDNKMVSGACPQRESFTAASWDGKYTPEGYEWWVKVSGKEGWLQVDGEKVVGAAAEINP